MDVVFSTLKLWKAKYMCNIFIQMDRWHLEKCYNNLFYFVFFIVYGRYAMLLNSLFFKTCVNVRKQKKKEFF